MKLDSRNSVQCVYVVSPRVCQMSCSPQKLVKFILSVATDPQFKPNVNFEKKNRNWNPFRPLHEF